MVEEVRSFDWGKTPLGPVEKWPQTLKTSVGIMLGAKSPIGIYWGAEAILLYNDSWRNLIGNKHPNALGKPAREVFPEIWEDIAPMFEKVMSAQGAVAVQDQRLALNRNGRLEDAWFDFSFNPIPDESGRIVGIFNIANEITQQKQAEEKIERLNADLVARARELAETNRELETFNYSVAHDLRTPLTAISGYLELARQECEIPEKSRLYLQKANEATLKMVYLIEGLLEFSRVSHEDLNCQKIDLGTMAQEIIHELQVAEPERQVAVRIADDGIAEGDPGLMWVVLNNLLGNAWKYTRICEQAQIEFGVERQDGGKLFFVRDNGPGFEMAEAEKLFIPFQRLSGAAEFRGHGIGLATVARIIDRHGGRIWAEGKPGKGASFYFTVS